MTARMVEYNNSDLTTVLQDSLKEYLITPLPEEKLRNTLGMLISEIQKYTSLKEERVDLGDSFYWDVQREQLVYKDENIQLTKKERGFLKLLFSDINREFPYSVILSTLWGETNSLKQDSLKTLVKQLRRKLPKNIIKNIFAYGYTITY
jgi:DNA-binding response OmpR family regulator